MFPRSRQTSRRFAIFTIRCGRLTKISSVFFLCFARSDGCLALELVSMNLHMLRAIYFLFFLIVWLILHWFAEKSVEACIQEADSKAQEQAQCVSFCPFPFGICISSICEAVAALSSAVICAMGLLGSAPRSRTSPGSEVQTGRRCAPRSCALKRSCKHHAARHTLLISALVVFQKALNLAPSRRTNSIIAVVLFRCGRCHSPLGPRG